MSDMKTSIPYDSPELHFDCPSNVSSFEVWKEAVPMLGRKGFQATGAGCTAKTKYNGTHASFGGGVGPDGGTWGCSADDGKSFVWQTVNGLREWTYVQLCEWKNMVLEEHPLVISNNPAGSSIIFISDFTDYLEYKSDGKTSVVAQWGTTSRPTPTAVAVDKLNNSTGTTINSSFATSIETNASGSNSLAGSASTTTMLLFIGVGLVLIVVICLALCLCLRSKPKQDVTDQAERSVGRRQRRKTRRRVSSSSAGSEDGASLLGEGKRDSWDVKSRRDDARQARYVD
ncbi:hypothetical protein Rt10032_c15g5534 [Rhodotorula toruloides]|uniref:Uncharacterized protein n=1 Tax=Rhodotorula toruloides TaxID=5286 RepID=A0A511KMG0_RHOTO|nr:hypothetical protein Rt10032_c15g5534 [Rhodotorula toruloides]